MFARIYRPSKTAMQSGRRNTRKWVLDFEPQSAKRPDALMGWSGSNDTLSQIRLKFPTKDAAIAHAERVGLNYRVLEPKDRSVKLQSYADNFRK